MCLRALSSCPAWAHLYLANEIFSFFAFLAGTPPDPQMFGHLYAYGLILGPYGLVGPVGSWAQGPHGAHGRIWARAWGPGPSLLAPDLSKNTSWEKLTCPICGKGVIL